MIRLTRTQLFEFDGSDAEAAIDAVKAGTLPCKQSTYNAQPVTQVSTPAQPSHIKTVAPPPGQQQQPAITPQTAAAPVAAPPAA
jgi:hypothetical protein